MCANWSHKREALSWLVFLFVPIAAIALSFVMPFAQAHPVAFKVLLVAVPVGFVLWVVVLVTRKK